MSRHIFCRAKYFENRKSGVVYNALRTLRAWNSLRIFAYVPNVSGKNKSNLVHYGLCHPRRKAFTKRCSCIKFRYLLLLSSMSISHEITKPKKDNQASKPMFNGKGIAVKSQAPKMVQIVASQASIALFIFSSPEENLCARSQTYLCDLSKRLLFYLYE